MRFSTQGYSAFAKDLLALVWAEPGITTAVAGSRLGRPAATALNNLEVSGHLQRCECEIGSKSLTRWSIADAAKAEQALTARTLERSCSVPYSRQLANPDFTQPPGAMPAEVSAQPPSRPRERREKFVEPRVSFGAAPRARQEPPSFNCDARRHPPVVRAGSLDALRLRSLRWGTDRGTPEVRMAVVEAKGSAA